MAYVILNQNGKRTREDFDPKNVTFRPPRVLDHGGKIIGVSYKGQPLRLQTPEMALPYGVGVYEDPNGTSKYSVDFSFRGEEENERLATFHEQLREFQAILIQAGIDNSMAWFKKKMSDEVIAEFFTPILKQSKDKETGEPDGKYPDTMKVKLDVRDGEFKCKAFAPDHTQYEEPLDSLLTKGTLATSIVIPSFLWFAGGKFGITIKAEQMRVKVPPRTDTYAFVDDEEDVVEEEEEDNGEQFVDDVEVPEPVADNKPDATAKPRRKGRRKADA